METNARYLTIGWFLLTAILATVGFVLWLNRGGGIGHRDVYQIRFGSQVSGLQAGAAVLFNGMRVGEVSNLQLDPADPKKVLAAVSVVSGTPVRDDTKAGIASEGLMGNVAVTLEGGEAESGRIENVNGGVPLITADLTVGRSLTQAAQETLQRVDTILGDNSNALKLTMDNLKVFSGALARNSERVDAVMTGLATMAGGGPPKVLPATYDLTAPKLSIASGTTASGMIVIAEPTAVLALQTQRLQSRTADGLIQSVGEMQWSDTIPKMVQEKVLQSFEDAGFHASLSPPTAYANLDRQLQIDIRRFDVSTGVDRAAEVVLSAKLLASDGRISDMRVFSGKSPSDSAADPSSVKALNAAFSAALTDLSVWVTQSKQTQLDKKPPHVAVP